MDGNCCIAQRPLFESHVQYCHQHRRAKHDSLLKCYYNLTLLVIHKVQNAQITLAHRNCERSAIHDCTYHRRSQQSSNFADKILQCHISADCKRGRRKGATSKKRQKSSKSVKKFFDTFRRFPKTSKIVKKRQKVFRHFSTICARHHFTGPFWRALNIAMQGVVMEIACNLQIRSAISYALLPRRLPTAYWKAICVLLMFLNCLGARAGSVSSCSGLNCIQCSVGAWKCLRSLPPDPNPNTG